MRICLREIGISGMLQPAIWVEPNEPDSFFDDRLKHLDNVQRFGINYYGVRFVMVDCDTYYCVEDIVRVLETYPVDSRAIGYSDMPDLICSFAFGIDGHQLLDVMNLLKPEVWRRWYLEPEVD